MYLDDNYTLAAHAHSGGVSTCDSYWTVVDAPLQEKKSKTGEQEEKHTAQVWIVARFALRLGELEQPH